MPYGIEIVNENGYIQIDGEYTSFSLESTGVGQTVNTLASISYPQMDRKPVVCVRPLIENAYIGGGLFSWASFTIRSHHATPNVPFEYAIYRERSVLPDTTSGYGVVVYNSSQGPVFSSDEKVIRVQEMFIGNLSGLLTIGLPDTDGNGGFILNTMPRRSIQVTGGQFGWRETYCMAALINGDYQFRQRSWDTDVSLNQTFFDETLALAVVKMP